MAVPFVREIAFPLNSILQYMHLYVDKMCPVEFQVLTAQSMKWWLMDAVRTSETPPYFQRDTTAVYPRIPPC
jgi:hypothetical protein